MEPRHRGLPGPPDRGCRPRALRRQEGWQEPLRGLRSRATARARCRRAARARVPQTRLRRAIRKVREHALGPSLMNFRRLAMVFAIAVSFPAFAQLPDLKAIAKQAGTPDIPGLKMVWLAPWGDVAKAHPWKNIIVHQTEGPAGSARGGAQEQHKNPTRRGVMVWVETDGTVYWAVEDHLVPTHTDGADRNEIGRAHV